jgi:hypothetical protein
MHSRILQQRVGQERTHLVFFDAGAECIKGLDHYVTNDASGSSR